MRDTNSHTVYVIASRPYADKVYAGVFFLPFEEARESLLFQRDMSPEVFRNFEIYEAVLTMNTKALPLENDP